MKELEIRCRVTKEEKKLIKEKAKKASMSLSEYIRYTALGTTTIEITTVIHD